MRISDRVWDAIIVVFWAFLFVAYGVMAAWPATYWIDMRSVHVTDAPYGTVPAISEDRDVKRDVTVKWYVKLERRQPNGFRAICEAAGGPRPIFADTVIPEDADLRWWVGSSCEWHGARIDVGLLPVGIYRVYTSRTVLLPFAMEKTEGVMSNNFRIYAPPGKLRPASISKLVSIREHFLKKGVQAFGPLRLQVELANPFPEPSPLLIPHPRQRPGLRGTTVGIPEFPAPAAMMAPFRRKPVDQAAATPQLLVAQPDR